MPVQHPKFQTTSDRTLLINFGEYGWGVEVAAISADGRRVLTVHEVGVAEIWDASSGDKVGELRPDSPLRGSQDTSPAKGGFRVFIEAAALNRDGSIALLGLNDGTAGTFRVHDGARLATLHPPGEQPATRFCVIRAVAYSPDGAHALVGFLGRSVGVWSEQGDRLVRFLTACAPDRLVRKPWVRDTLVSSIAMSGDGRRVFAGAVDMTATIWDVQTGEIVLDAMDHAENIVALFDDDHGVGWATAGGAVWVSRDGSPPTKVISSGELWAEVRFDRGRFLTRGYGGEVQRWDLSGRAQPLFTPGPRAHTHMWSDTAETLAFHGGRILYPQGGYRVRVNYDSVAAEGTTFAEMTGIERDAQLVTARFSPTGRAFATGGSKNAVELWAIPGGRLLHTFASPGGVGDFAFSSDGAQIAIGQGGHDDGRYVHHVRVYDTTTGHELVCHGEHTWQISRVEFSPDGRYLASLGDDLVLWALDPQQVGLQVKVDRLASGLQFLRDGRLLVIDRGRVRIFRGAQEVLAWDAPVDVRTRWCVGRDGRTLNVALNQAVVRFDLDTGAVRGTYAAEVPRPDRVPSAEIAIEVEVEAHAGAALWRTEYGLFLHQSDGPRGWVQPLHLSPDGIVAVPAAGGAAVLHVGATCSLLGVVPFEGKLRASRVVGDDLLLVNELGDLVRRRIPTRREPN